MKKRSVIVAIVVAVAAVLGIGVFLLAPRSTNEISGEQAVGDFRSRNKAETTTTVEERATPQPGVYTFSASGQETVKLGPLPAENRAPAASTGPSTCSPSTQRRLATAPTATMRC